MVRYDVIKRRDVLVGGAAAALMSTILWHIAPVGAQTAKGPPEPWEEDLKRIIGTSEPVDGKMQLDLTEVTENGNTVPFTISVESPMTAADHVKGLHVIATGNPQPLVASFRLTPAAGLALVSSRMRLVKSQDVVGVAELSNGNFILARRAVKVTIACCGY